MTHSLKISLMLIAGCWLAYLSFLAPTVVYSATRFAPLYPADSLIMHPELSEQYKAFVSSSGVALAICLGVGAAAFGVWRASILQGFVALVLGAGTTVMALSIVPMVRFPEDQYPPAALFVMADGAPLVLAFVVATLAGWLTTLGHKLQIRTRST